MSKSFTVPGWFLSKRHKAEKVTSDKYQYNLYAAEFNPCIVDFFCSKFMNSYDVIWEPFAGQKKVCDSIDICKSYGIEIIAYNIHPNDERIIEADSTKVAPCKQINGAIFHPPYFGSCALSKKDSEISRIDSYESYRLQIQKTVDLICERMLNGYVCVVGRPVFISGKKYPLDWIFTEMFVEQGFIVLDMIQSEPDTVIFLEKP